MLEAEKVKEQDALKRLQEISVKILSQLELAPLLKSILKGVLDLVQADRGQLFRYDPEQNEAYSWVSLGIPDEAVDIVYKPGDGIVGEILITGKSLKVDDYDAWEGRAPQFPRGIVGAVIMVTVKRGEEFLGALGAGRDPGKPPFSDEDLEILQLFANQAAVAISNARLYEEAKRSAGELSSLYDTSLEITKQLDLSELLERIIQRAVELAQAREGQFYLYDETRQELIPSVPYRLPEILQKLALKPGEGLSGKVLSTREPIIVDDYDSWEGRSPQIPPGIAFRSAGVPVEHGDRVLGVLTVGRDKEAPPFTEHDVRLLTLFASQAAVAITNARLYEQARRSAEKLSSLYQTSLELAGQLELDPLLQSIIKRVVDLLEADIGELYRYDPQRQELHPLIPIRLPDTAIVVMKPGEGVAGKILLSGEPLRVDDYDAWEGRAPQWPIGFTGPALGVPVKRGSEFLGVITVARNPGKNPFTEEDVDLLQLYANQVAVAIANARLYEETKRSAGELSSLYEASLEMASQLEPQKLLEAIVQRAMGLLRGQYSEIVLYDPQRQALRDSVTFGLKAPPFFSQLALKPGQGLDGKVFATGQPMIIEDYNSWEGRVPDAPPLPVPRIADVPIKLGKEILGTLKVNRRLEDTLFDQDDVRVLTLLANQAAVAISNARLYEDAKRSADELSRLYETSIDITRQLSVPKLLEAIMVRAAELLHGTGGIFFLYDPASGKLHPQGQYRRRAETPQIALAPGEGLAGKIYAARQPMAVEDYDTWAERSPQWPYGQLARLGGAPMILGESCLGVIIVDRSHEDPPFGEQDLRLLSLFANQAAIAISNARLYEETSRNAEELSSLYETSLELASKLEPQKLLEAIVHRAEQLLRGGFSEIVLYDPQKGELRNEVSTVGTPQPYQIMSLRPGEGADGRVFVSGLPLVIEDYNTWEGKVPDAPLQPFPRGAIVPIKLGAETIGTLKVARRIEDPPFIEAEVRLLTLLANQAAVAISNARLYEETSRRAEELSTLYDTSLELTGQLEPQKLLEAIALRAWRLLQARVTEILLYDPQADALRDAVLVSRGEFRPSSGILTKPGEGIDGKVFKSGQPLIIDDYNTWEGRVPGVRTIQASRMAAVPIKHREQILGTLKVRRFSEDPSFTPEEVRLLSLFANQAAVALTNARQYEELQKLYSQVQEKERLESELRVAHNIQSSLLPHELPKIRGWELGAMWTAARVISGDFYDCFPVPGGKWGFVIADVAGKGIPAALFMALCRTLVRTFCMDGRPPREAITRANDLILADSQSDWFITLFYGLLDPKWGILTYVNAGHPPPLWYRRGTEETLGLKAEGMALGVVAGPNLEEKSVQLEAGDLLLFYTDGLSEARDAQDRLFGERRIRNLLKKFAGERPPAFLTVLQREIAAFAQGRETGDDLTAILLKRK